MSNRTNSETHYPLNRKVDVKTKYLDYIDTRVYFIVVIAHIQTFADDLQTLAAGKPSW